MSASRERKKRVVQEQQPAPAQQKKKKLSEGWIFAICMALIVVVVFGGIFTYRAVQRNKTVLTVGEHKISVKEFNYFYNSVVNSASTYANLYGIKSGVGLNEQKVSTTAVTYLGWFGMDATYFDDKTSDGETYDVTWAQYFASAARDYAVQAYTVYDRALADGYQADADEQKEIDNEITTLKTYAKNAGYSASSYLKLLFGSGSTIDSYRDFLNVTHTAEHYIGKITYTDEQLEARYNESPADFDAATYYCYTVNASSYIDATEAESTDATEPEETTEPVDETVETAEETVEETTEETVEETTEAPETTEATEATEETTEESAEEKRTEPNDEERAMAKKDAEAFAADFDESDDGAAVRADQTREKVKSGISEEAANWLFDEAKPNDVKLFASEDNNTYYVLKLIDKEDYFTSDLLYMLIKNDEEKTDDTADDTADGTADNTEDAEPTAEEKLADIRASMKEDGSEDNFKTLMTKYGATSTDVQEAASRATYAYFSKDALKWGAFEDRKAGDWSEFETSNGTYVVYYVGQNETLRYWNVTNTLKSEAIKAAIEVCNYDESAAMAANVNLALNTTSSN